ncbi:MAG: putative DNA binding domain-containing protein [Gammaproteobacteria bacterium]|nr:putative DNA binding domain-containing protein [Gammaproteobacteria bacterium]
MIDEKRLAVVNDLLRLPAETAWAEFKQNVSEPSVIGKRISALANSARLAERENAYMVWGVRDSDHAVVGTNFRPDAKKVSRQPLEFWLARRVKPDLAFTFYEVAHPDGRVVVLEIPAATVAPIEFDKIAYVRIGSATPQLSAHPARMRELWAKMQPYVWEHGVALQFQTSDEVLSLLDYPGYFDLMQQPLPNNKDGILGRLKAEKLIAPDADGHWNITNLGAILFAKDLARINSRLARKQARFVAYYGDSRTSQVTSRMDETAGYAIGFQRLIDMIVTLLPHNEHIGSALRTQTQAFPGAAIRELVANALIHQDFTITGTGPLIELFPSRFEVTNPGTPLISVERFIDFPPRSRNEALASLMRRMGVCEEQGIGIDKVVESIEHFQLPPPDFRAEQQATRVVLFASRPFAEMTRDERIRACYQHTVLLYVNGKVMRNASLRERLGIESRNSAQASQIIRAALDRGLIRPADAGHPKSGYVPAWA